MLLGNTARIGACVEHYIICTVALLWPAVPHIIVVVVVTIIKSLQADTHHTHTQTDAVNYTSSTDCKDRLGLTRWKNTSIYSFYIRKKEFFGAYPLCDLNLKRLAKFALAVASTALKFLCFSRTFELCKTMQPAKCVTC